MVEKNQPLRKRAIYLLSIFLVIMLLTLGLGEAVMRLFFPIPAPPYDCMEDDSLLGWKNKPGYHYHTNSFPDNKGGKYPVELSFDSHGFRKWKDCGFSTCNGTVWFIGDSYVESIQASNNSLFYSIFKDSVPLTVYAAGTAGYGTTQELMLLKMYVDTIKPDYVVLEMCANDFADNYWKLEQATSYKVGQRRPYLNLQNNVEYHHPHYWVQDIKGWSYFLYFLTVRVKNAFAKMHFSSGQEVGDKLIAEHGLNYDVYAMSYQLTGNCLKNIQSFLAQKHVRLMVLNAGDLEPGTSLIRKLCRENNIAIIDSLGIEVRKHENAGEVVRAYDGYHWNNAGQKIVADEVISYFKRYMMEDRPSATPNVTGHTKTKNRP